MLGKLPPDPIPDTWLFEAVNSIQNVFLNWTGELSCHNISAELLDSSAGGGVGMARSLSRSTNRMAAAQQLPPAVVGQMVSSLGDITRPWNYMVLVAFSPNLSIHIAFPTFCVDRIVKIQPS
jgi:hypothetical protein